MSVTSDSRKPVSLGKSIAVVALLFVCFSVLDRALSTWLGNRALAASPLANQSLAEAIEKAGQSNKPVLVNFSAIWCPACLTLQKDILSDPIVVELLETHFHYVRVEYENDAHREIFNRYNIRSFPSLRVLEVDGSVSTIVDVPIRSRQLVADLRLAIYERERLAFDG